jgi:threonine/homoserine/homoserine lactone efflux protein
LSELLAFLGVSAVVIVTPGQDTALTIRNVLQGGRSAGVATAFGVSAGQAVWAIATSAGLAALLIASEPALRAVRLVGAAYLIFLGAQALLGAARRAASRKWTPLTREGVAGRSSVAPGAAFRQGLISNLGNPKMAVFFTSLLPQFTDAFPPLALGLVFSTMTLVWLSGYSWAVGKAAAFLLRDPVRRALEALMGAVLLAFGVRLAVESTG